MINSLSAESYLAESYKSNWNLLKSTTVLASDSKYTYCLKSSDYYMYILYDDFFVYIKQ